MKPYQWVHLLRQAYCEEKSKPKKVGVCKIELAVRRDCEVAQSKEADRGLTWFPSVKLGIRDLEKIRPGATYPVGANKGRCPTNPTTFP